MDQEKQPVISGIMVGHDNKDIAFIYVDPEVTGNLIDHGEIDDYGGLLTKVESYMAHMLYDRYRDNLRGINASNGIDLFLLTLRKHGTLSMGYLAVTATYIRDKHCIEIYYKVRLKEDEKKTVRCTVVAVSDYENNRT